MWIQSKGYGSNILLGHNKESYLLVFDDHMTLERKSRWIKDGHKTPEPKSSTFAKVVSTEIGRVALTCASLNDFPI